MTTISSVSGSIYRMQSDAANRSSAFGRLMTASGMFLTRGAGEATQTVSFPVTFTEMPILAFGGHLDPNQQITTGSFPTVSVIIGSWVAEEKTYGTLYHGANLIIVTTGLADQLLWVHWSLTGSALTNPVSNLGSAATTDSAL